MRFPRPVRGVVFDMDGVLIDSEAVWRDAQLAEAKARDVHLPLEVVLSLIGNPHDESSKLLRNHFGPDFDLDEHLAACGARAQAAEILLKGGVIELLDALDALGLPRAVATSSSETAVQRNLGRHGLLDRFDAFVAAEHCVNRKPHPEPYLNAARALGLDPADCLALEDSHTGVRSAHAAGMMTVMTPDLVAPTEEIGALCVAIATTLHDVREALLSSRAG